MTPFERKGWGKDTVLEATRTDTFTEGSLLKLFRDDGSAHPLFTLIEGKCGFELCDGKDGAYYSIEDLKPTLRMDSKTTGNIVMEDKKLTPCEKLGYKVGDQFTYNSGEGTEGTFEDGSIVQLIEDNGTGLLKVGGVGCTCVGGDNWAYARLSKLTPLQKEEPWVALASPEEVKTKLQVGSSVKLGEVVTEVIRMYASDVGFETVEENPWDRDSITDSGQVRNLFASIYYKPSESPVAEQEGEPALTPELEEGKAYVIQKGGWGVNPADIGKPLIYSGALLGRDYNCKVEKVDGYVYASSWAHGYSCGSDTFGDVPEEYILTEKGEIDTNAPVEEEACAMGDLEGSEECLVTQPNHYLLFPEHELEVKHITKRVLDDISNSDMEMTLNQGGWLQQAMQYLLRCSAKGGWQDIEKAKEALEIMLKDKGEGDGK